MGQPDEQRAQCRQIQDTSQYLALLLRKESFVSWLWAENQLQRKYPLTELFKDLKQAVSGCHSFKALSSTFRVFKQKHFLRIGGRDCLGWAGLEETMAQLADLADVCLQVGLDVLGANPNWWTGKGEDFDVKDCPVTVLGLGKLGGGELNYVSDIDLIYLGAGDGPARKDCSARRGLLQALTSLLSDQADGDRVFKVDLRLRPQGKDGDLVPLLEAAVHHYLVKGRAWERQALLKARTVAGNRELGATFLKEIKPFVYRRFLDFQSLDELRDMRDRLLSQARQANGREQFDVKLGLGGIREIEFIVQSFQLIYGGRYRELDEPNTLRCLEKLEKFELMPQDVRKDLHQAYTFLRRLEHWIQLDKNRQSHRLPKTQDEWRRLVRFMGYGQDQEAFSKGLEGHRKHVSGHFEALFARSQQPVAKSGRDGALDDVSPSAEQLNQKLFQDLPQGLVEQCTGEWRVLTAIGNTALLRKVQSRLERFAGRVRTRPGLCRLLDSKPSWMAGFCQGLLRSQLIADLINTQPALIEGLPINENEPQFAFWKERAESILSGSTDFEQTVEWIRRLKNERLLTVALAEMRNELSPIQAATELSRLAGFVLEKTLGLVSQQVIGHSSPSIAVLALGKLGSCELSYLSDLDLLFVYEPESGQDQDSVPVPVIKCIQRFMRLLSTPLQEGPGYEVDTRLRPTGNYGPLAVSRQRWKRYYSQEADIWEVQSLLRIRQVAGDRELGSDLVAFAMKLCAQPRDPASIWPRLCRLRQRMEHERGKETEQSINLKLGFGGLTDLEFLIQGRRLIADWNQGDQARARLSDGLDQSLQDLGLSSDRRLRIAKIAAVYQALEHSFQIYHKQSGGTVQPELLQEVARLRSGSDQPGDLLEMTWEDLLSMRREVRSIWNMVCAEAMDGS